MEQVTPEKWRTFNDKQQWDIITALRGPDTRWSDTIKWFTTNVIRAAMMRVTNTHGSVNDDLKLIVIPDRIPDYSERLSDLPRRVRKVKKEEEDTSKPPAIPPFGFWSAQHFLQHVREAAEYLHIPVVTCPVDAWEKAMMCHVGQAGIVMLEAIEATNKENEEREKEAMARTKKLVEEAGEKWVPSHYLRRGRTVPKEYVEELRRHVTKIQGRW